MNALYRGYLKISEKVVSVEFESESNECGEVQDAAFILALTSTRDRPSIFFHDLARAGIFVNTFLSPTKMLESFEDQGVDFNYLEIGTLPSDTD